MDPRLLIFGTTSTWVTELHAASVLLTVKDLLNRGLDWPQCQSRPCAGVKGEGDWRRLFIYLFIYLFIVCLTMLCVTHLYKGKKGKVAPVHFMKACRGSRGIPPLILDLGTGPSWAVNFALRVFYPRQRTSYLECEAGWVPELTWTFWSREHSCPCRDSSPGPFGPQPSHYTEWAIPALNLHCLTPEDRALVRNKLVIQFVAELEVLFWCLAGGIEKSLDVVRSDFESFRKMKLLGFVQAILEPLHLASRASLVLLTSHFTVPWPHSNVSFMTAIAHPCVFELPSKYHMQPQKVGVKVEQCHRPTVLGRQGKRRCTQHIRLTTVNSTTSWWILRVFVWKMPIVKEGKAVSGHVMKGCRGSKEITPLIINPRTRWKLVINFTPLPLYHRKRTQLPIE